MSYYKKVILYYYIKYIVLILVKHIIKAIPNNKKKLGLK